MRDTTVNDDIAVRVEAVSKRFRRGEFYDSLRDLLPSLAGRWLGLRAAAEDREFWALRDVSFVVRRGEVLGIVGANGAGKSTLLKVLAKIIRPTSGTVCIQGRLRALIEIAAGFHPDLTGRENIYLNGAILGMKKAEIDAKFDEIVEFSGISRFLDTPVKRYSSGMFARLGFAVAAHLEPEILLVDEVLAVGDAAFQAKCLGKMREVAGEGRTVLFVSHNMRAVTQLCSRAVSLDAGRIVAEGPPEAVVAAYLQRVLAVSGNGDAELPAPADAPFAVRNIRVRDETGRIGNVFPRSRPIVIELEGEVRRPGGRYIAAVDIRSMDDMLLFRSHSFEQEASYGILAEAGPFRLACIIPAEMLPSGRYLVGVVTAERGVREFQHHRTIVEFEVFQDQPLRGSDIMSTVGVLTPACDWRRIR
ncbi:MAG: ABC transporter ATP-binding protein [Thermogutta sp.]